jgi:hypothetical protein
MARADEAYPDVRGGIVMLKTGAGNLALPWIHHPASTSCTRWVEFVYGEADREHAVPGLSSGKIELDWLLRHPWPTPTRKQDF